jgi:hypothetical protein
MLIMVDIDDTICYYEEGIEKRNYALANPYTQRIDKVNKLFDKGHTIIYWTARGTMTGINWFKITIDQLEKWGCKYHELRMNKPAYDLFIDDKNMESKLFFSS